MGKGNTSSVCTCDLHVYIYTSVAMVCCLNENGEYKIYQKYKFSGTTLLGPAVTGK